MKLTTEPSVLPGAVRFAIRVMNARPAYPLLGGVKITATEDGTAEVSAFDYDTSALARIPAEVGEPGTILVPGRLLARITTRLPRQPVQLAATGHDLTLSCGSTQYTLRLFPLDEYPALPELPAPAGHAEAAGFATAVDQVVVAASRDDTLATLGAVQATYTPGAVILAATDRYRAALARLPWQPAGADLPPPVLIPAPAFAEAARAAVGATGPVGWHLIPGGDGAPVMAGFGCPGKVLTTRLTSGEYPSIAKLFPTKLAATAVTDTAGLAAAVKRLAVVAARDTPVRLAFTPGQLELQAGNGEEVTGSDTVACELDGSPAEIAFNPRLLLDALASTSDDRTRIGLADPDKPALFTPATSTDDGGGDRSYQHLLMPIRTT